MKITSSYGVEIKQMNNIFRPTVAIYNEAITFCVDVFESEWSNLVILDGKSRNNYAENLIHSTKNNVAKYSDFDTKFYKMPSYMRRSVVASALGYLSSYHNNLDNWYDNGCKGNTPTLQKHLNKFPTFYKYNMYESESINSDTVQLKIFVNKDWNWMNYRTPMR